MAPAVAATLLLVGIVLMIGAQLPHPAGSSPANQEQFAAYATSSVEFWTAVHLAQFAGEVLLQTGLIVLFFALNLSDRNMPRLVGILGALSAVVGVALAGVVTAVDGVALKQAVDAWASAPAAEKTARLASAEAVRWLEWGTSAYWIVVLGLAAVLNGIVIAWTGRVPRPIGVFMGAAGLLELLVGWFTATAGFGGAAVLPTLAGFGCLLASAFWLLLVARRAKTVDQPHPIGLALVE